MAKRDGITRMVSERTGAVTYKARFSFVGEDGRRRHRAKTFDQRNRAKAWLADRRHEVDRDAYADPSPVTVAEVADRWLADIARSRAPSTALAYRQIWDRHVAPELGHRTVAGLRPTTLQSWYDALGRRYAGNTVAQVHKVVRGILAHAVTDGIVRSNVAEGRRIPHDRPDVGATWTTAEAVTFARHAETDDAAILFAVMLGTGLRVGEALALAWADVDLEARSARIHRTVQKSGEGLHIAPMTKTGHPRTVALPGAVVLALRRQRAISAGELVFPGRAGGIMYASTARRRFLLLCERIGVPFIGLHGLRRTAVTLLVAANVHPATAAAQMGHDTDTMLRHYARISDAMQRDAADAIDAALATRSPSLTRQG